MADIKQMIAKGRDLPTTAGDLAKRWATADARERNRLLKTAVDRVIIKKGQRAGGRFDATRIEIVYR